MKQFTNKLDFSLTLKRFLMMSKSTSFLRSFSLKLTVFPVLSIMFVAFCTEVYDGHPNEIYTENEYLSFIAENKSPRGSHWGTYFDSNGNPYTGEINWYFKINNQLARKELYQNGKQVQVDIYNTDGTLVWLNKNEVTVSEDGTKYLKHFQKTVDDSIYLAFDLQWKQNSHTVKEYHINGQLKHQYTYDTSINRVNGIAYEYDQEGNLLKQERYENGELVETIK